MNRLISASGQGLVALIAATLIFQSGCGRQQHPVVFEPNLVHATKYQIQSGIPMSKATEDVSWVLTKMFGTPNEPRLPEAIRDDEELASLVSMDNLTKASGPAEQQGRGLYRKHCYECHGITGNGRGPSASLTTPYPRDYRMGIFKFKSTPRGVKPTKDDLARTISQGVAGTMMKKIPELGEEDVDALVDYVIYLSIRGELERQLLDDGALELDLEAGDRIVNSNFGQELRANEKLQETLANVLEDVDGDDLADYENYREFERKLAADPQLKDQLEEKLAADAEPEDENEEALLEGYEDYKDMAEDLESDPEEKEALQDAAAKTSAEQLTKYEKFSESWEYAEEYVADIAESWLEAKEEVVEVPEPPEGLPVADSYTDFQQLMEGDQATALAASVERGHELFTGKIAACSKCHGERGLGDGQTTDYDDWVKDWTTRVGLKPEDRETLIPLLARGALPPINAKPRNFQEGIFRGGSSSADLYRRITQGIDGTPMPAVTFVEGQFEEDDVWHLINFVRSMQQQQASPDVQQVAENKPEPAA